jgi:hypothetical protein
MPGWTCLHQEISTNCVFTQPISPHYRHHTALGNDPTGPELRLARMIKDSSHCISQEEQGWLELPHSSHTQFEDNQPLGLRTQMIEWSLLVPQPATTADPFTMSCVILGKLQSLSYPGGSRLQNGISHGTTCSSAHRAAVRTRHTKLLAYRWLYRLASLPQSKWELAAASSSISQIPLHLSPISKSDFEKSRSRAPVAHTCNLYYLGGWDQEDHNSKSAWANNSLDTPTPPPSPK